MVTFIQSGHPKDVKEKRILRIQEAIGLNLGTKDNPMHHVIAMVNGNEVYFNKPGKEFFRESKQNINDMTPNVGNLYSNYSFGDIWKDLLNLSARLSLDSYKKICVILYRLAYLMDCKVKDELVRYTPEDEVLSIIEEVQREIDETNYNFKLLEFLYFVDVLSWNEDVKYHPDCEFVKPRVGRINTILSLISIPLIFKEFVDVVIENKDNLHNLDYSLLIDTAQTFSRTRGVQPLTNVKLISYLSPYLQKN